MERIIRVGVVFTIVTLACILAIITANGELTWATAGLVAVIVLIIGLAVGVWTIVHGHFSPSTEVGLTIGILVGLVLVFLLLLMGGSEIEKAFKEAFGDASAWWLVWPVAATVALTVLLDLHRVRRPGRR